MPGQTPLPPTGQLPPFVPSVAQVWIGKDDGWPYQIQLIGKPRSLLEVGADRRPRTPAPDDKPTKLTLLYANVVLEPKLEAKDFAFTPPDPKRVVDTTEDFITRLDRKAAENLDRKKAAAAKGADAPGGEETLPSVTVPKSSSPN